MAIPASGSVSLSTIQSEWGGSNPISLSEYYSGSLASNSNPVTVSHSVGYSYYINMFLLRVEKVMLLLLHTTDYRQFGHKQYK